MANWSGELAEYMAQSMERQGEDDHGFNSDESAGLASDDPSVWLRALQSYTSRWVLRFQAGLL